MLTLFQFTGIIIAAALVVGSSVKEVLFTLALCFAFNSCDFNFDWEGHMFHLHPNTSELAITAISYALPILHVLHVLLSTICFLSISAITIYAMLTVLEFFFVAAKRVLVYILKGRQMLSQLRWRPTQPVLVDTHNLLQPEPEQQDNAPSPATTTSSISAGQEATQRPQDRHVAFSVTSDTTCVYYKGLDCPLAEQEMIVFKGASKLRDPSRRVIKALYGISSISQTNSAVSRQVVFDPTVLAETGRVTSNSSLYLRCRILQPILEEDLTVEAEALGVEDMEVDPIEDTPTVDATRRSLKRKRSTDDSVEDASLALSSKRARICASPVQPRMKRKLDPTTAEVDDAVEQKIKRARICADASQDQSKVAEVSQFIDCSLFLISLLCLFSSSQPDIISYCSIHYHHVSKTLSTTVTEPVEDISFEVADDTIVEDVIIAEEEPTELVREEVEAMPQAALRHEVAHVQSEVVEVSRFIDCSLFLISLLCLFSSSQSDMSYCSIHPLPSCIVGSPYCRD